MQWPRRASVPLILSWRGAARPGGKEPGAVLGSPGRASFEVPSHVSYP
jgi:hypothetical protein